MTIPIDDQLIIHVARLARLALSDAELAEMHGHFEKVLGLVESLESLDTSGVDPSVFPLDLPNVLAEDRARPSLTTGAALANGPSSEDGFFLVPRIIAEDSDGSVAEET